ncbi:hypothetical protein [Mycobacterium sp. Marseille-P9652]|nr:hypothetical protein [Mycobacterium sp. Marseille-P9652]
MILAEPRARNIAFMEIRATTQTAIGGDETADTEKSEVAVLEG